MVLATDAFSSLDLGALGTIEDEEGEKGHGHEASAAEEEGAEFWILALAAIGGVVEPDAGINTNAEATLSVRVGLEAVLDGEMSERTDFTGRAEDLCGRVRSDISSAVNVRREARAHIPKTWNTHSTSAMW